MHPQSKLYPAWMQGNFKKDGKNEYMFELQGGKKSQISVGLLTKNTEINMPNLPFKNNSRLSKHKMADCNRSRICSEKLQLDTMFLHRKHRYIVVTTGTSRATIMLRQGQLSRIGCETHAFQPVQALSHHTSGGPSTLCAQGELITWILVGPTKSHTGLTQKVVSPVMWPSVKMSLTPLFYTISLGGPSWGQLYC